MNRKFGILASLFLSLVLMMTGIHEAQAKRMGGGKSFGSRPSYSAPYQRSTSPGATSQTTRSASQQQAATQNQAARQSWAGRGGLMGMLGGLALGGLLGSLFFGGAFENLNLMDMLVFAGIAYLLYRLFAARAKQSQPAASTGYSRSSYNGNEGQDDSSTPRTGTNPAGFNTDVMFGKANRNQAVNSTEDVAQIPADFDKPAFLAGAESAFRYLQSAWDKRDLAAIRGLTTDKVFAEIQDQLKASSTDNKTEVLKLTSELLEVREEGTEMEAVVLFDSIMREDDGETEQVREVWHFIKPVNSKQTKWFLDGIQQLEI
ncbi:Tim44 domain-containing protein [Methylomonas sp. LL1]|uniref:Tim44 domain-containing protein n=1 Tax=Methylomonas sp. LL1 TaxID=2785785 RepID=UPI0018C3A3B7|nr:Tim44-like domain-containing protein [Methylomonas sp. LL1]QPK62253.1 Tim44 domain-containing protein [Methylomonas sp. LL1]